MGYLFENMEKMDIQTERKRTEVAQKQAESAHRSMEKAQKSFIEICQKDGKSKENTIHELIAIFALKSYEAEEKADLFWKTVK